MVKKNKIISIIFSFLYLISRINQVTVKIMGRTKQGSIKYSIALSKK